MEVSVRELKAHLSEYLRRAQAGEEITIYSRQEVVGRLVAPAAEPDNEHNEMEAALARLRALPWVRVPDKEGKPQGLGAGRRISTPEGERPLSELVMEDRE
jgi:prevent-host-death family protein